MLEEEKRRERRFGRIHVCLQGTAKNCASTTLIGDPFELDLPPYIEVWLFRFPRLTWTELGNPVFPWWSAIGDPLRNQASRDIEHSRDTLPLAPP